MDESFGRARGAGNIGRADDIGMIEMTTLAAQKDSTNKAIAFVEMSTFRARPARDSRIDSKKLFAGGRYKAARRRFSWRKQSACY